MRELIALIPFLDIFIIVLLLFFIYLGWNHGIPRLLMVVAAVYTGFLLASIYYHLFAVTLVRVFNIKSMFAADLISFLLLHVLITVLMLALLLTLFSHIEIKGRAAVFDKLAGSLLGLFAGVMAVAILVTLLRVPFQTSAVNTVVDMPAAQLFNNGYEKSALAPYFTRATPLLMRSVVPMLPPEMQERGAVPLLASIMAQ